MKQKKENRITLLLQWAGEQKIWLLLAILLAMASGLCIIVPYIDCRFCGSALCFIWVFRRGCS